jgi:hypothetical protein
VGLYAGCIGDTTKALNAKVVPTFISKPSAPLAAVAFSSLLLAQRIDDGNVFEVVPMVALNFGYIFSFYIIFKYTSLLDASNTKFIKHMRFISYNLMLVNLAITLRHYSNKQNLSEFIQEFYQRMDYIKEKQ